MKLKTKLRKYWPGYLLIVTLLFINFIIWQKVLRTYPVGEKTLTVVFLNVRQGDSIFIETPLGKHILIDGGPCVKEWSSFDAGKNVLIPYLRKHRIRKLDLVVATHPDLDHIGGLLEVVKRIPIKLFLDSGTLSTTYTYEQLLKEIERRKIKYKVAKPGIVKVDPSVTLEVLSQIDDRYRDNPNDNSIVLKLSFGKISFLFTGDITQNAELFLVHHYGNKLSADILKAPHHGSNSSSSLSFLKAVAPKIYIISCGKNPFGHPHKEVVDRILGLGIKLYRTDKCGHIIIKTDGEKINITTER